MSLTNRRSTSGSQLGPCLQCGVKLIATLTIAACLGCGGGGETAPAQPAADTDAAKPAAATKAPMPAAPTPESAAPPKPAAPESDLVTRPDAVAYVVAGKPAFELVEDPQRNMARLGPANVNPNAFQIIDEAGQSTRPQTPTQSVPGLTPRPGSSVSPEGYALEAISSVDSAAMVLVPAGQFLQGRNAGPANESPEHAVYLSTYYIDATEVTVGRFLAFNDAMKAAGERTGDAGNLNAPADHPVLGVSFRDAQAYAEWAGKQLPTEAQWEKSARGTQSLPNVWGRGRPLWIRSRQPGQITAVRYFPSDRSLYGVFDLAGNAREWCRDTYSDDSYAEAAQQPGGVARDWAGPSRPKNRSLRVVRGSSDSWSVTAREGLSAAADAPDLGFRCVLEIAETP